VLPRGGAEHVDIVGAMRASVDGLAAYMQGLAGNKKIAEAHARYIRSLYEALLKADFTPEEALQIVASAPLPGTR